MAADRIDKNELPTSFGAFKPVGYVVAGLPDEARAQAASEALLASGFEPRDLIHYGPLEERNTMREMIDNASELAGFGHEIVLMKRYQELSRQGCAWLLVYAPEDEQTARAGEILQAHGALIATKYNRLLIEDLIQQKGREANG